MQPPSTSAAAPATLASAIPVVPPEPLWKDLVALPLAPVRFGWGIVVFAVALIGTICFWLCRGRNVLARGLEHFLRGVTGTPLKLAQWAAGRPDLIGPGFAASLAGLLDDVRPPSRWFLRWQVRGAARSLGLSVSELSWPPLGAGSVATVVKARLADGSFAVFKLARPFYAVSARADRWLYLALAWTLHPFLRHVTLPGQLGRFARRVIQQSDMRIEARNLKALALTVAKHPGVKVPQVIGATRWVCVMQFLADAHPLGTGPDDRVPAIAAIRSLLRQLFYGPCLHGDAHRANLLVTPDRTLWLIDGGLAEYLTEDEKRRMTHGLSGFVRLEPKALADALIAAAPRPPALSPERYATFEGELRVFCEKARIKIMSGKTKLTSLVLDLFGILRRYKVGADPNIVLANATLALSESYLEVAKADILLETAAAIASRDYTLS